MGVEGIPVVDFGPCGLNVDTPTEKDKKTIGDAVYEALATVGFVYLKNTGVTEEQIEKLKVKSREFFDLDTKTKEKYLLDKNYHGYVGNGQERLNPKRPGDLKEVFDANGPGMTSEETTWPDDVVPQFSDVIMEFSEICKQLSMRLLEVVAIGMDIKDRDLFMRSHSRMNGRNNYSVLRSLLYRPIPKTMHVEPNQVRLGEHSDYGSLTFVFQDLVGGLQVEKYDGTYMDATPIPGTAIVNIGDCLQYWTQGRLKATKHRILLPEDENVRRAERTSVAYFVKPDSETMLEEIEYGAAHHVYRQTSKDEFKPMTAGQYNEKRFKETYFA